MKYLTISPSFHGGGGFLPPQFLDSRAFYIDLRGPRLWYNSGGRGRKSKKIVRVNADFIVIVLYLRSFSSDSYGNNK